MPGFVQVMGAEGTSEIHALGTDQVTVGRGEEATLSVPGAESLEPQHLLLVPRPDGCWVSVAREARTTPRVNGHPLEDGELPWGTEIVMGDVRVRLSRRRPGDSSKARPLLLLALVAAVAVAALASMRGEGSAAAEDQPVQPSPLFDPVDGCDAPEGGALHRAAEALHAARAGEERYPFEPQDGVDAVQLYRQAAACFGEEGLTQQAGDTRERGRRLEQRMEEDYRTLRLALSRQLTAGRTDRALDTTRSLRALLRHRSDPYAQWLGALERRLVLALDQLVETE